MGLRLLRRGGPLSHRRVPACSRARIVSYDRPYAYGEGAGDFLGSEYPFIRFVEQHGLDVAYVTDVTSNSTQASCSTTRLCFLSVTTSVGRCLSDGPQWRPSKPASTWCSSVRARSASCPPPRLPLDPTGGGRLSRPTEDPLNGKGNPLQVTGNIWASRLPTGPRSAS